MNRSLKTNLLKWKENRARPLLLRGARQVGKTYLLREFGDEHFSNTFYFNFERRPKLKSIFEPDLNPERIVRDLGIYVGDDIQPDRDLLIFDEIQECPEAVTSLKYFAEELPELAVCAAGSLLGVKLGQGSFPVGKIDSLNLYPMSFLEYLEAIHQVQLKDYLLKLHSADQVSDLIHEQLWNELKNYFVTGGLPDVVSSYVQASREPVFAFRQVRERQEDLIIDYLSDIAKHAGKENANHIERVWQSVPRQLARNQDGSATKFRFKGILSGNKGYQELSGPIDWLEAANILIRCSILETPSIPLSAEFRENFFKLYSFDVGILGAMSDLDPAAIQAYDYGSFKGYMAENYVAQEFMSSGAQKLYSWSYKNSAEVEFLLQHQGKIIPVEVKSGTSVRSKSLQSYCKRYDPPISIVLSARSGISRRGSKLFLPLYLAFKLGDGDWLQEALKIKSAI